MRFTTRIANTGDIEVGKTYFKDPNLGYPLMSVLDIKIMSHAGGVVTAQIGNDGVTQTLTETEAMLYINCEGGYSNENT